MADSADQSSGPEDPGSMPGGTPHDALFKRVLARPEHAAEELRHVLPAAIARAIDWRSLRSVPATFVGPRLAASHADLLFSVRLEGRDALIYVLFEHKSTPGGLLPLQLLGYIVRIWERHTDRHGAGSKLPPILPVVVLHGRTRWVRPADLLRLVDLAEGLREQLAPFVPDFRFVLDDLGAVDEDEIVARAMAAIVRLALLCLRGVGPGGDVRAALQRWAATIRAVLATPGGVRAVEAVYWYIVKVGDLDADALQHVLAVEVGPEAEEAMKTTYDQPIEKGREQGQAEGRAEMLLRLLAKRFGSLAPDVVARVRGAGIGELDTWAERVLTADTLEDVLGS